MRDTRRNTARSSHGVEALESRRLLSVSFLKDINPTPAEGTLNSSAVFEGKLYFTQFDASAGVELWRSDGTAEGTALFKDIWPGVASSSPSQFTPAGDVMFFIADDGVAGRELWKTDGTEAGTVRVADAVAGPEGLRVDYPMVAGGNGLAYFLDVGTSERTLWRSDGTAGGTIPLHTFDDLSSFYSDYSGSLRGAALGAGLGSAGQFVFSTADDPTGYELWVTDGTPAGTRLLKDIRPGPDGSFPAGFTPLGDGRLVFRTVGPVTMNGASASAAVWVTDGTAEGTTKLQEFTWNERLFVNGLTAYQGRVYYRVTFDPPPLGAAPSAAAAAPSPFDTGRGEFWCTDGTVAGTTKLVDFGEHQGWTDSYATTAVSGGVLYFTDPTGRELWRTDGTPASTLQVATMNSGHIGDLTDAGGTLYFNAGGQFSEGDLWKSDGTAEGTGPVSPVIKARLLQGAGSILFFESGDSLFVADESRVSRLLRLRAGTEPSYPNRLTASNGILYFTARVPGLGEELYRSDGTPEGTYLVKDINAGPADSGFNQPIDVNGTLYFWAVSGAPTPSGGLWKTDGTAQGTVLVKSLRAFDKPINVGGTIYFAGSGENDASTELWKSDGTPAGTVRVKDIYSGTGLLDNSFPDYFQQLGGAVLFVATDRAGGRELWRSDGTAASTVRVKDIESGNGSSYPSALTPFDGSIYFFAQDSAAGIRLWKTDGTEAGTVPASGTIAPKVGGGYPFGLTAAGGVMYFVVNKADGLQVWKSDGTPGGTVVVSQIPGSLTVTHVVAVGTGAFIQARTTDGRSTFWHTDGTAAGTRAIIPVHGPNDPASSVGEDMLVVGDELYFSGTLRNGGRMRSGIFRSDGTDAGTRLVEPGTESYALELERAGNTIFFAGSTAAYAAYGVELLKVESQVTGRNVFYRGSPLDADGAANGVGDDHAIAPDKRALLPGETPGFANITSYTGGITGVMVDVDDPPGTLTADDFDVAMKSASGDWAPAPAPTSVTTRRNAGDGAADRVTLAWPEGVVRDAWLRVTVKPTGRTGLSAPDVFYFGNLVGKTGEGRRDLAVNAVDLAAVRRRLNTASTVAGGLDFDRNGRVDALDLATVRRALNHRLPSLVAPLPVVFADASADRKRGIASELGL